LNISRSPVTHGVALAIPSASEVGGVELDHTPAAIQAMLKCREQVRVVFHANVVDRAGAVHDRAQMPAGGIASTDIPPLS
jgi:hypothetical protein